MDQKEFEEKEREMKCKDMNRELDILIYHNTDARSWKEAAIAIIAAGWRPKDIEHNWKKIPFGAAQVQECADCDEARTHSCLIECEQHEDPTEEQRAETRRIIASMSQYIPLEYEALDVKINWA